MPGTSLAIRCTSEFRMPFAMPRRVSWMRSAHAGAVLKDLNQRLTTGFSADELATVERWLTHVQMMQEDSK